MFSLTMRTCRCQSSSRPGRSPARRIEMRFRSALQINLHPLDVRHAVHTLPHQLEVWGDQVDRIVFTVDTRQITSGRYSGNAYGECRRSLFALLEAIVRQLSKAEIAEVDYSPAALESVRPRYFSASRAYLEKAFDG